MLRAALCALPIVVLTASAARAQGSPTELEGDGREPIDAMLREAATLRDAGDLEGALDRLEAARRAAPADPRVAYGLGAALADAGQLERAWELLREASIGTSLLVRDAARERLASLEHEIGVLRIEARGVSRWARVRIDERTYHVPAGAPLEVAARGGTHEVELTDGRGVVLARASVLVRSGRSHPVALQAPRALAEGPPVEDPPPSTRAAERAPPGPPPWSEEDTWIVVGVSVGAAAITALVAAVGLATSDGAPHRDDGIVGGVAGVVMGSM